MEIASPQLPHPAMASGETPGVPWSGSGGWDGVLDAQRLRRERWLRWLRSGRPSDRIWELEIKMTLSNQVPRYTGNSQAIYIYIIEGRCVFTAGRSLENSGSCIFSSFWAPVGMIVHRLKQPQITARRARILHWAERPSLVVYVGLWPGGCLVVGPFLGFIAVSCFMHNKYGYPT